MRTLSEPQVRQDTFFSETTDVGGRMREKMLEAFFACSDPVLERGTWTSVLDRRDVAVCCAEGSGLSGMLMVLFANALRIWPREADFLRLSARTKYSHAQSLPANRRTLVCAMRIPAP